MRRSGFTLLEIVVVVAILVILAGLVLPLLDRTQDDAASTTNQATLVAIRDAISAYANDMGGMPQAMQDLYVLPTRLLSTPLAQFDPQTRRGWRGPYLSGASKVFTQADLTKLDLSFGQYVSAGDIVPLDAWGRPVIMQTPPTGTGTTDQVRLYTRLVAAGPDGKIQTPANILYPAVSQRGDDLVLFIGPDIAPP